MSQMDEDGVGFGELDPERWDPGYWQRFQRSVMGRAAPELLRRRSRRPLTVGDVVQSWTRLLVPTMVAAAVTAAFILAMESPAAPGPDPELEAFSGDVEGGRLPPVLAADSSTTATFAAQEF